MKKKKIKIEVNGGEAFPIYEVHSPTEEADGKGWPAIDVDEETLKNWKSAFEVFEKVQEEIIAELRKQGHADQIWYKQNWTGFHIEIK